MDESASDRLFRIASHCIEVGAPGIKQPMREVIARNICRNAVPRDAAELDRLCADNARLEAERDTERERCAKIAEDWLATFGNQKPQHVSAQTWACDAVRDIAQLIRRPTLADEQNAVAKED